MPRKEEDKVTGPVSKKTKILVDKHRRNSRTKGATLNAKQMMVMANVASCFNRCATFPYISNQHPEISDTITNIKTGLEREHPEETEQLRNKMHEIAEIINKIK